MITVTPEIIYRVAPQPFAHAQIVEPFAQALNDRQVDADVTTPLRMAHFLAQAAHESDGFHTMEEYASGRAYEGRPDLGNFQSGDGVRYKGRGPFQLTGRANYRRFGLALGLDLEGNPMLAADPTVGARVALLYWKNRDLNVFADKDDIRGVTKRINGGYNGLADREYRLVLAKLALGVK